jgi:hypothetical protein
MSRNTTRRSLHGKRLTSFGVVRRPKRTAAAAATTVTVAATFASRHENYVLDHDEIAREIQRRLDLALNRREH